MLRPDPLRRRPAVTWTVLLLALGVPSRAAAQDPTPGLDTIPRSEIEADSLGGFHFGGSLAAVWPSGEAVDSLSVGVGGSAFAGVVADGRYVLRLRVGGSTHADMIAESRTEVLTVSLEGLVKLGTGGSVRPGLQIGYARLSREFLAAAGNGTHVGLILEARAPFASGLHGRLGVDWVDFGELEIPELSDPDRLAFGRRATLGVAWIF